MPAAKKRPIPATSPKSVGFRAASSLQIETHWALEAFVRRFPAFRAEIDAELQGPNGARVGHDLDAARYDLAGLADLLWRLENNALPSHPDVYEPGTRQFSRYKPVVEPVAYRDSLALIVARMQALADRLETYLQAIGGSEFDAIDDERTGGGIHAGGFRVSAWATRQALRRVVGMVDPDALSAAKAMLAGALNAEVAAADAARLGLGHAP